MDIQTAASVAALAIAVFAMVIALSQVSQQFATSGHQYRLCDRVVYGGKTGLPGQGRRAWSFSQLRFRVVYDVPTFRLLKGGGRTSARQDKDFDFDLNAKYCDNLTPDQQVGEASWVSFYRKIKDPCADRIVLKLLRGDADRCPGDLSNIPMPVSLQDVVIMAFTAGLDCSEASFLRKTLSMHGDAGSITTSQYPILGPLIHFTPQSESVKGLVPGNWSLWRGRLRGLVPCVNELIAAYGRRGLAYVEENDKKLCELLEELESRAFSERNLSAPLSGLASRTSPENDGSSAQRDAFLDEIKNSKLDDWVGASIVEEEGLTNVGARLSVHGGGFPRSLTKRTFGMKQESSARMIMRQDVGKQHETLGPDSVSWYWMSQINIFEGPWATPWKSCVDENVCRYAFKVIRNELLSMEAMTEPFIRGHASEELRNTFRSGMPFQTYPPYAYGATQGTRDNNAYVNDSKWVNYPAFGHKLPRICIIFEGPLFTLNDDYFADIRLYTMELMKFDYWLWRAFETTDIAQGNARLQRSMPAVIEYVMRLFAKDFENNYIVNARTRELGLSIWNKLRESGLSDAECTFAFVALLRTLRVAICISTGQDTSQTL